MAINTWKGKHGPLLIAEIGGNHEGNFEYAKALTRLAIESNVDYVKFQLYQGDTLVSSLESPDRNKHFKKFELSKEQYIELAELCQGANVGFLASVWDFDYISWIDPYMDFYKIGSGDLTAYPVLKKTVQLQKPILLSTGLSTQEEVMEAVGYIQNLDQRYESPEFLAILQCTSMYPIPNDCAHLNVMKSFRTMTSLPVGYSDHTEGSGALEIAVAMGAQILEFHFTDSREGKTFRDHKVSLTKDEVQGLIKKIKVINNLAGSYVKKPLEVEGDHVVTFRRACYPRVEIKAGEIITEENLTVLRPNHGIDARDYSKILGKKAVRNLSKHQKLTWEDFA
ncbi:MAG: N-acetylneuraminate synthase family protein [Marinoscillum sp.]